MASTRGAASRVSEVAGVDRERGEVFFVANREGPPTFQLYAVPLAGGTIRRISMAMDPRSFKVWPIGAPRNSTERIASIRPRGESASSPVTRKVGQCGRHNPHATQVLSSSGSSDNVIAAHRTSSCHAEREAVNAFTRIVNS